MFQEIVMYGSTDSECIKMFLNKEEMISKEKNIFKKSITKCVIVFFVFISLNTRAQIATPTVYSSAGGTGAVSSNFIVDYTIGECMITTLIPTSGPMLTQGFNQPIKDSTITPIGTPDSVLGIYTGLTPNGDAHNDVWIIGGIDTIPDNTVHIYNRWGELIWKGDHYDNLNIAFAGKNTKNQDVVEGTYYYTIDLIQRKKHYVGWIELSR